MLRVDRGHDADPQIDHQFVQDPAPKDDEPEADRRDQEPATNTWSGRCAKCLEECRLLESLLLLENHLIQSGILLPLVIFIPNYTNK